jgi:hypothetical protein
MIIGVREFDPEGIVGAQSTCSLFIAVSIETLGFADSLGFSAGSQFDPNVCHKTMD